jgi:IS30 family transposase
LRTGRTERLVSGPDGLLRQYFRKGSDLGAHTLSDLHAVEQRIKPPAAKRLAWGSSADVTEI